MSESPRRARGRPRAFHDKTEENKIKALDRSLSILTDLSKADSLTLSELSERTGEAPATVYRALITFADHEIVQLDTTTQLWRIGPGAFRIGSRFLRRNNLLEHSRPILRKLMQATNETANLGVENHDQVLFVSQEETHQTIRAFFPPGTLSPMHSSGIGKALLAEYPPERVLAIIQSMGLTHFTNNTITDPEGLKEDLATIRRRGYSFDNEERTEGMRCVAAVVKGPYGGAVAGISISAPTFRLPENRVHEIGNLVVQAAADLTRVLGGEV